MCAINGFNFKDQNLILRMNRATSHRGPDQTGYWLGDEVSLGHNRLSIIDLSPNAKQPMWDDGQTAVIVFNGEIYNFQELRNELVKKYKFKSQSDTEVILYAYKEYGIGCLNKFNGIFAFAIWDDQKKELLLARDRMGIKPLYYFWDGKNLIFSSEIKAILENPVVPREVDSDAFNLYFHVLYVPEPYTMFGGIKKLPQASYLLFKNGKITIKKYWQIDDFNNVASESEAIEKVRDLFRSSVRGQLISDRPVGVFLSGGLDSTAVLGAVQDIAGRAKTFSVGFDTKIDYEKFNADFLLARKTAQHYGTDHHELFISAKEIGDNLEKISWHLDEPNANPTAGAIFLLSQMAKQKVAVVLGGDGGDELFGGYPRYAASRLASVFQRFPRAGQAAILGLLLKFKKINWHTKLNINDPVGIFLSFLSQKQNVLSGAIREDFIKEEIVHRYFGQNFFAQIKYPSDDFEKRFMNTDRQSWLVDESLLRTDKMSMAFGLEERVPILDYRLVELANKIPTAWKISNSLGFLTNNFQGKRIWHKAIAGYLPPHVLSEQKRGWFTPMAKWIRSDLKDLVSDALSPANLTPGFFNADGVQRIWHDHLESRVYNMNLIWAIVMWQFWYNQFIKKR